MSQRNRLGNGGRIDRKRPLRFTFNGVSYQGFAGDTLASALMVTHLRGAMSYWTELLEPPATDA